MRTDNLKLQRQKNSNLVDRERRIRLEPRRENETKVLKIEDYNRLRSKWIEWRKRKENYRK